MPVPSCQQDYGQYLGKGQQIAIDGRLQTRQCDDDHGVRQCLVTLTSLGMIPRHLPAFGLRILGRNAHPSGASPMGAGV